MDNIDKKSNIVLDIQHLSIRFTRYARGLQQRELKVLEDLSLQTCAGQVVAVVGASGSGKSLLAHGILGLLPYNSELEGTLLYNGEALTPRRAAALRGKEIVLVPQGVTYLDPLMKVGAQVRGAKRSGVTKATVRRVLGRYGLGEQVEELYPFELSGGMARRVLIATAVTAAPRLVIADEPTPGLDATTAARILQHLRELADEGAAVLLITHDLQAALTVADRVAVFYAGQTLEEAAAADFASPATLRHPYTRALWAAMPQHGFAALPGTQPPPGQAEGGCIFAPRCPQAAPQCRCTAVPLTPCRGGLVRCLYPTEETPCCKPNT